MNCFRAVKSFPIETVCVSEEPSSCSFLKCLDDWKETGSEIMDSTGSQVVLIGDKVVSLSGKQGRVYVYNTKTSEFCSQLYYSKSSATSLGKVVGFDNIAVVGYENGEILLWDLNNPSVYLCNLVDSGSRAHLDRICCLKSTSKEYPIMISCSDDGIIKVWNLSRFSCDSSIKTLRSTIFLEKVLQIDSSKVTCCNISHDGNQLVTGCKDGSVRVWDLESRKECCILLGHVASVTVVSFYVRDTNFVISGGEDETIRLWNYLSGNCVLLLSSLLVPRDFIFIEKNLLFAYSTSFQGFLWNLFYSQCLVQVTFYSSGSLLNNSNHNGKDNNGETSLNAPTSSSTRNHISIYYNDEKYQVFIPTFDGSILTWNCYPLVQKWKGFIPLKELFEMETVLATQAPKMACSSSIEIENSVHPSDSSIPFEQNNNQNTQLVLHLREQRLSAEKQSIHQQRRELELWTKNLEETKDALEELYNRRVENLERQAKIINDLYRQTLMNRSSNESLPPIQTMVSSKKL